MAGPHMPTVATALQEAPATPAGVHHARGSSLSSTSSSAVWQALSNCVVRSSAVYDYDPLSAEVECRASASSLAA